MCFKLYRAILLFLSLSAFQLRAQKPDSLLSEFDAHQREDTATINSLLTLANEYEDVNPDHGIAFSDRAIILAEKLNRNDKLAEALLIKGENEYIKRDYNSARVNIEKALDFNRQAGNKTGVAACLNSLGRAYCYGPDQNSALAYFQEALHLDSLLSNKEYTAKVFANMGFYHLQLYDYNNAIYYFQKAFAIYELLQINSEKAGMLIYMGRSYLRSGKFPETLESFQKALDIYKTIHNNTGIANSNYWLGKFYTQIYVPRALGYFQNSLSLYEQLDARYYIASTLNAIGTTYTAQADSGRIIPFHQKSIEFYSKALNMSEQLNYQQGIELNLRGLAFDYICSKDYYNAMKCLKRSYLINQETGDKNNIADNLEAMSLIYYTASDSVLTALGIDPQDKYSKAAEQMKTVLQLFQETGNKVGETYDLLRVHDIYIKANRYDSAYVYYRQFIVLRDSTFNIEKQKGIMANELRYDFNKKEDSLRFHQELTDEKLKGQMLFAKQQQQQLALNLKELDLINKEKDLQKLAYLKTQTDLQNEELEKKEKEKRLIISENEKQLQEIKIKTLTQEKSLNDYKQQRRGLYVSGILLMLGLVSIYFFYRARLKEGRLKTEIAAEKIKQQQKDAAFQRQLGDVSLSALRSQMNPHFIFNCLNSIKLYTTQHDTHAASEYLTKFSKLIRSVMENSRNDRITLLSEIEALKLYIEMEAMRFKEKLQYDIQIDGNVEADYIEIPPLLLQPYVENAIWHGLMHKEEGGRIDITVAMEKEESLLEINIIDNGIGRSKSAELRSKTATKHKSYGMKVTSERIALINQIYKTGASVVVHDLLGDNGLASGTRVTIQIPV